MDIITTHINADFDCLGSMVAAQLLYPEALAVFAGAREPAVRDFLEQNPVSGLRLGRIKEVDLDQVRRLILVDVNSGERIGPFSELIEREDVELHIFDHHPLPPGCQADVVVVERVGATVTLMVRQLKQRGLIPDASQATVMMLGLYEDTGNLLFPSTTGEDFAAAAWLLACGADLNLVADSLSRELSSLQVEVLHQLLQSRTMLTVNGIEVCLAQASVDRYVGDLAVLAHKIRDMENLDALIIAVRLEDRVFLVARSRLPEVHVGRVLAELGGGGHATAASATVREQTLVQIMEQLPSILLRHVRPQWQAQHLMTAPVRTIDVDAPLRQASALLTRYTINALAVLEQGTLVGLVTRQTVERALHHGLGEIAVREYMSMEFGIVSPRAPLAEVQEIIVGQRQRFVPVVEGEKLVGVITRTDLLRHLVSGGRSLCQPQPGMPGSDGISLERRQVLRLMETRLPRRVRQLFGDLSQVAEAFGIRIYAVGGSVRDLVLNKPNLDVDVVVEGNAIRFAHELEQRFDCRVRAHEKFVTAVVIFADGFKLDLASTRTEYYLEPGALPTVEEASLKLDLYRRDFTINTLALSLNQDSYGELIDYFGAQRDLRDGAIRVLHNLSFVEDPTRILRAVRFEQRLGFSLGLHTEHLLRSAVAMDFLDRIGPLRLFNELTILLNEAVPWKGVQRLQELGVLAKISPLLIADAETARQFQQAGRAIGWYELLYTGEKFDAWVVYLLCLFSALKPSSVEEICDKLTIPQRWRNLLVDERQQAWSLFNQLERQHKTLSRLPDSQLAEQLGGVGTELLLYGMARTHHESVRLKFSHYVTAVRETKPLLSGKDLLKMGCCPGPKLGYLLRQLRAARLDGLIQTRDDEIALVDRLRQQQETAGTNSVD
ncbi:MAG: CBS domain-containing protein [Desulfuromonadaceae bacterium]|nr:CBS domain-containing protein [Desulfuromonadaceae bacterium]